MGEEVEIGGPSVNPVRRKQPSELIATGIAGIDLNNTLVTGQKIPFFADPDQPFNQVMATVALRAQADKIILGGMGLSNDDYLYYKVFLKMPVPLKASSHLSILPKTRQ
jgi:V/A-type H+/Na+-transporting ATPase subunit B